MRDLTPLIAPRSIALIGASNNAGRVGGMPLALLVQHGYQGNVYPVNPKYQTVFDYPCFPDIESVPDSVDVAVLALAAQDVVAMLRRCHAKGIRNAIVFASGFAEAQEAGRALQVELEAFVRDSGMVVAGPNCMGFANLNTHAYTVFASVFKNISPPVGGGDTALVTQSGNVCATVYSDGRKQNVRFNYVLNTGNEACLEFSEYLEWLAEDKGTQCIVGYVEGLRDGERFCRAAVRLRELGKPLALLKVGDSGKGQEAAASHTAALSGNQRVYHAALKQLNVMQARDLSHIADLAYLAQFRRRSAGRRVVIMTISGALGALLADRFSEVQVDIPTLPDDVQEFLRSGIPDYGMVANPVDVTGNIVNGQEFFPKALEAVLACEQVDVLVMYAPGYLLERMSPDLVAVARRSDKLIAVIDTQEAGTRKDLEAAGIPVFGETGRAVQALGTFLQWKEGLQRRWTPANATDLQSLVSVEAHMDEEDAKRLLAKFGVPLPQERVVTSPDQAAEAAQEIGFPCVLKVLSADILHKTDVGGVRLQLSDPQAVQSAYTEIANSVAQRAPSARVRGMLLARQEQGAAELLVGVTRDPVFGLVMTVGLGGVLTELYQDVAHRLLPVSSDDAREMLHELKAWPLLDGFRGRAKADVNAACDAIAGMSQAALALQDTLQEMEVNPLLLRKHGEGVVALDALIRMQASARSIAAHTRVTLEPSNLETEK
jgi:acetate---CoA ligase (ADP-forming)